MTLRTTRLMTSVFLYQPTRVLLLYRRGSRAISDSWVGLGGHIEPSETTNPTAAILREIKEEAGLEQHHLTDLALRYVAVRDTGEEIRTTYYFTARLADAAMLASVCSEGELRWFDLPFDSDRLEMPPTARAALKHWLDQGRHDQTLRSIVVGTNVTQITDMSPGGTKRGEPGHAG